MKRFLCIITTSCFVFLTGYGQTNKKIPAARPSEQKEIKADQRLEKEIQQKQLSSPPEQLGNENAGMPAKKESAVKQKKKHGSTKNRTGKKY